LFLGRPLVFRKKKYLYIAAFPPTKHRHGSLTSKNGLVSRPGLSLARRRMGIVGEHARNRDDAKKGAQRNQPVALVGGCGMGQQNL